MLSEGNSNKSPTNKILIFSCTFSNNTNDYGGALSAINIGHVSIQNSKFLGNQAKQEGGAVYFSCSHLYTDPSLKQCTLSITNTTFQGNLAQTVGGAIKWDFYEPWMENLTFRNNQALIYGDDIASVPK